MIGLRTLLGMALLGLALFLPSAAQAAGEYEPNDEIGTAVGPLVADTAYYGTLESDQDEDWFWAPFAAQQQISIAVQFSDTFACFDPDAELVVIDGAGRQVGEIDSILQEEDQAQEIKYTTPPSPQALFFMLRRGSGSKSPLCEYGFAFDPPTAASPVPAQNPVVRLPEPDNAKTAAHLIGGEILYAGSMETSEDVDQLVMNVRANQKVHLELTSWGCGGGDGGIEGRMSTEREEFGFEQLTTYHPGQRADTTVSGNAGGLVYVALTGGVTCEWQFWAWPASALSTEVAAPSPPVDKCRLAQHRLSIARRSVTRLRGRLRHAGSRRSRGRLHHRIEAARRKVRAAKHAANGSCRTGRRQLVTTTAAR